MNKVVVVSIIVRALGRVNKDVEKYTEQIGNIIRAKHIQKTALLGIARILGMVLEI